MIQILETTHPRVRPKRNSRLLALTWPSLSNCIHLEQELVEELSLSVTFNYSSQNKFKINK